LLSILEVKTKGEADEASPQIVDKVVSASNCWSHFVLSSKQASQQLQEVPKIARKRGIFSLYLSQFL